ncbi:Sigma factor algU negative regulatory protein AlgS [Alloalcanivorax dieselolei B5]|uniref:Sigma factor algU negative regulatory protein AlgS n=1 Tax=Alcanivorax dieselolei (strain DSM 16502 / CGMCC 1.3690 / MCCC 1A00001 / B-5) TaxID=930169 RepID=K0CBI6_ALCDB|nr:sigma-E factor negative regulatory protein [Alloalcanivorax dieselolei]AFT69810.1 Sigma factor algU negative regulatory protein AlgS [Alloalcanivorax dieselolei B5]GGJ87172.1 hypothetical protein GCM10007426_15430 [Alloalcanivorax dieselolei]
MKRDFEVLSALLDGETNEFETRRVLRDLDTLDESDLDTLARWQLTRDVMHGQAVRPVPSSFNARLSEALAAESAPARRSGLVGGFARVAVAASVAAATVVGWQYWSGPSGSSLSSGAPQNTLAANDQRMSRPFGDLSLVSQSARGGAGAVPVQVNAAQPRVNAMLMRHSEFAARHSGQGMMPYARLVSMDARNGAR